MCYVFNLKSLFLLQTKFCMSLVIKYFVNFTKYHILTLENINTSNIIIGYKLKIMHIYRVHRLC